MAETITRIKPPKLSRKKKYRERKKLQRAEKMLVVSKDGLHGMDRSIYYVYPNPQTDPQKRHVITVGRQGIEGSGNDCDCHNGNSPCSHVIAIRLYIRKCDKKKKRDERLSQVESSGTANYGSESPY